MGESTREKKYVEGHDLALKAKELDPDNPGVYYALASYATSHGDPAGGRRAVETRLSLEPKNPNAYNSLAVRLYYEGEPQRSIELLTQAINLDPKHPTPHILSGMGRAYFMLGDNDAAVEWLSKTLEMDPTMARAYAYLAMAYASKGEDARARAAAAEARRLDPIIRLSTFEPRWELVAFKKYYENKFVPAWRKAGLPE
jgi:Flp pilus assembly protein TadD